MEGECDIPERKDAGVKAEGRRGERKGWTQLRGKRAAFAAAALLFDFVTHARSSLGSRRGASIQILTNEV